MEEFNRYEFIEFIVRAAHHCHKVFEVKRAPSSSGAVELVLERMYGLVNTTQGKAFRKQHCYDQKVAELLQTNEG